MPSATGISAMGGRLGAFWYPWSILTDTILARGSSFLCLERASPSFFVGSRVEQGGPSAISNGDFCEGRSFRGLLGPLVYSDRHLSGQREFLLVPGTRIPLLLG